MSNKFENRENSGVLFKEENKKNPKGPDYRGSVNIGGEDYTLAGWIKESKKGTKFLSLSVETQTYKKPSANDQEDF